MRGRSSRGQVGRDVCIRTIRAVPMFSRSRLVTLLRHDVPCQRTPHLHRNLQLKAVQPEALWHTPLLPRPLQLRALMHLLRQIHLGP